MTDAILSQRGGHEIRFASSLLRFFASSLLRFGSAGALARGCGLSAVLCAASIAQTFPVEEPYSTHDWTASVVGEGGIFNEAWADVKAPGDGRQYAVGTIEVRFTGPGAQFSGAVADRADLSMPIVALSAPNRRQVVILQVTDENQGIVWQRYYYGSSLASDLRATNARGISVWAGETAEATRIAICGETYDEQLPLSPTTFSAASAGAPAGFIAVFDGTGALLWSHHAFGVDPAQSCAITDVSIRVDAEGDVVTYCGISSHGVPTASTPLSPEDEFPAFLGSGGATNQGPGQWDGIVGRVRNPSTGTLGMPEFHAIVGGPEQDGLFGIAEIEDNRFVVVGGTRWPIGSAPTAGFEFPGLATVAGPLDLAPVIVFGPGTVTTWAIESMFPLGSLGTTHSLARDVLVMRDGLARAVGGQASPALHSLAVVGSTDDPNFLSFAPPGTSVLQGATDGFVAVLIDAPGFVNAVAGSYHGGPGRDGLTGVQGWNEYTDYVVTTGFTEGLGVPVFGNTGLLDISVESFYVVTDPIDPLITSSLPYVPLEMRSLRRAQIGGSNLDRPAAMGATHATTGLTFDTGMLNEPAGGGITVNERARVNVVGQTLSSDYHAIGGRPYDAGRDAVRSVFDLVPPGVGRTDGTGAQAGFTPVPGFTGGTSPPCALSRFGKRIGDPAPAVARMLIEYEGPQPTAGVTGAKIIVMRPTAPILPGALASSAIATAFQVEFPGLLTPFNLIPGAEGFELWINVTPGIGVVDPTLSFGYPNQSFVYDLFPLPTPATVGQPMVVQVGCWVPSNVPGGVGAVCTTPSFMTGTAAMWLPL